MPCYKAACCLICLTAIGCEATNNRSASSQLAGDEQLVEYSIPMKRLFDDEFGGVGLGTPLSDSAADEAQLLSRRTLTAGNIFLCTVGTVTEGVIDESTATSVEFRTPCRSLSGSASVTFQKLAIPSGSYSYSILRQSGASLAGRSAIIFVRYFAENGQPTWHWHVEPANPAILGLVQRLRGPLN
jgi:hypothetical protein